METFMTLVNLLNCAPAAAGGGGDDGGVVLADGGHRAAQERRHRLHLPRLQLQHDAGVQGGGHTPDEP